MCCNYSSNDSSYSSIKSVDSISSGLSDLSSSSTNIYKNKKKASIIFYVDGKDIFVEEKGYIVESVHRHYKPQLVIHVNANFLLKNNYWKSYIDVCNYKTKRLIKRFEIDKNDVIFGSSSDFASGKTKSKLCLGFNDLYKVTCIDDVMNPLFTTVEIKKDSFILSDITLIIDEEDFSI